VKVVVCDSCGKTITSAIYPVGFGISRKDACSPACKAALEKEAA